MEKVHQKPPAADDADWAMARRALSDPLRLRMFEALRAAPATAKRLGEIVGMEPNRLYYHLRLLIDADIVEEVGREASGRMVERVFGLTGRRVSGRLGEGDPVARSAFFGALLEATRSEVQDLVIDQVAGRRRAVRIFRGGFALTPKEFKVFAEELDALVERVTATEVRAGAREYRFTFALYEANEASP